MDTSKPHPVAAPLLIWHFDLCIKTCVTRNGTDIRWMGPLQIQFLGTRRFPSTLVRASGERRSNKKVSITSVLDVSKRKDCHCLRKRESENISILYLVELTFCEGSLHTQVRRESHHCNTQIVSDIISVDINNRNSKISLTKRDLGRRACPQKYPYWNYQSDMKTKK